MAIFLIGNTYIYLELACHDEQNGCQIFVLCPRITKLWQFIACKVEKDDKEGHFSFFNAGLWQIMRQRMVPFSAGIKDQLKWRIFSH